MGGLATRYADKVGVVVARALARVLVAWHDGGRVQALRS